ncbi:MAG: protein kinase [Minicystis sp.]
MRRLPSVGAAEVYLARSEGAMGFARECELKLLPDTSEGSTEFGEELAREAAICGKMKNPAVVRVLDFFEHQGKLVLALEHVEGTSLADLMASLAEKRQKLGDAAVYYIGARLADAIADAHAATDDLGNATPIIHRNLTPENVLLSVDGDVRLTGFGVGKILGRTPDTAIGKVKGTPGFMAPEQARGEPVTTKADVYGLGVLLWSLLAGRRPPTDGTWPRRITGLQSDLPREVSAVVDAALDHFPGTRRISAREIERWLAKAAPAAKGKAEVKDLVTALRAESSAKDPEPEAPPSRKPTSQRNPYQGVRFGPPGAEAGAPARTVAAKRAPDAKPAETKDSGKPSDPVRTTTGTALARVVLNLPPPPPPEGAPRPPSSPRFGPPPPRITPTAPKFGPSPDAQAAPAPKFGAPPDAQPAPTFGAPPEAPGTPPPRRGPPRKTLPGISAPALSLPDAAPELQAAPTPSPAPAEAMDAAPAPGMPPPGAVVPKPSNPALGGPDARGPRLVAALLAARRHLAAERGARRRAGHARRAAAAVDAAAVARAAGARGAGARGARGGARRAGDHAAVLLARGGAAAGLGARDHHHRVGRHRGPGRRRHLRLRAARPRRRLREPGRVGLGGRRRPAARAHEQRHRGAGHDGGGDGHAGGARAQRQPGRSPVRLRLPAGGLAGERGRVPLRQARRHRQPAAEGALRPLLRAPRHARREPLPRVGQPRRDGGDRLPGPHAPGDGTQAVARRTARPPRRTSRAIVARVLVVRGTACAPAAALRREIMTKP